MAWTAQSTHKLNTDTLIVIPNDKLLAVVPHLPLNEAFEVADEVLMLSVKGLTELITKPGLIGLRRREDGDEGWWNGDDRIWGIGRRE